ncbi:unnamed protein product [Rotaria magnacalcarata]|uniref:Protein MCM10 homolog n=2 Tax=Rotaria TaxID=231623 RepID=A0A819FTR9_9BILA|nr:unnamed protein product [Rotaria magnacalcarata]CAF3874707.1 unnamed protein product [Rotaria magnacalcarata]
MENEIDDDELAAILAADEQEQEQEEAAAAQQKNEELTRNLSFSEQAETMTREQLVELACALVDKPKATSKNSTYKFSDKDMGELFGSKTSNTQKQISKIQQSSTLATLTNGSTSQSIITPSVYIDPTTHIRIGTLNYTPSEIKLKLSATKFIRLFEIDKQPPPMPAEWCTMAVLISKSDVKQASNGSTYSIWRITDFKTTINMFLFGDAHQSLWKTTLSSVLLIYEGDAKKPGQLSIKYERNISILGSNPDLGQCKAKTKSGEQCKMFVNRHECEYCVTHAHQLHKSGQRNVNKFNVGNNSRMNLQSTGSFVPKKFAGSSSGGGSMSSSSWSKNSSKTTSKNMNQSSKPSSSELNTKEKSMLVMLGIEDDPLVCLRTQESKGLADSMADVRELYEAKQAAGKVKRIRYDERKTRDDDTTTSIRSYPLSATKSPTREVNNSPLNEIRSQSVIKKISSPKQFVDLTKTASSEAITNAKQRAIDILKQRLAQKQIRPGNGQSLISADAIVSSSPKRSNSDMDSDLSSKRLKTSTNNSEPVDQKRFLDVINMKSSYSDLYSQMTLDEMFERYQKKENIEEKLLQVMERDIKVVVCRQCHYTAYKQSILCKQKQHYVKICEVKQKFFECVECHKRVFTWSQYPVDNCTNCHSLKGFRRTALIRERHGAKFDDEILLLRGEEEKFLNSFVSHEKLPDIVD